VARLRRDPGRPRRPDSRDARIVTSLSLVVAAWQVARLYGAHAQRMRYTDSGPGGPATEGKPPNEREAQAQQH
jgi:hypothetical protein